MKKDEILEKDHKESKELKENMRMNLKYELDVKLEKEYNDFKEELEQKSPKEIIEKAYELVMRHEIKEDIRYRELSLTELKALVNTKDVLSKCYDEWEENSSTLDEAIYPVMDNAIEIIERDFIEEEK